MHILRISLLVAGMLVFAGCKKQDTSASQSSDNCTVQASAINGQVIPGQYIVAYKSNSVTASTTQQRVSQVSRELLQENSIPSTAIKQSFYGTINGFVAQLT